MKPRNKVDDIMKKLEEENPNANWKNLITGLVILLLVGIFSIWYFSNNASSGLNILSGGTESLFGSGDVEEANGGNSVVAGAAVDEQGMVVVLEGEGLWQVAERVCGDSEKYNHLADANGYSIWWAPVVPGQELVANCGN